MMAMTEKTRRTAACQLLAQVALVGAAIAVPMTVATPAMATPTSGPGVVQADRPGGHGGGGYGYGNNGGGYGYGNNGGGYG